MKIIYIHQYFKTPREPGSTRSYHIIHELIEAGHRVTVIGSKRFGQEKSVVNYTIDGIDVVSIRNAYEGKMALSKRAWSFFKFMCKSTFQVLKIKDADLVIATSTPLTIGFPALMRKWMKGTPFVFEVRDLWPEVPIQMGAVKNDILKKALRLFERTIYKNAKHVIALSPGMKDGVVSVLGSDKKVSMIPNMSKMNEFYPRQKNHEMIKALNLDPESFKVIHFGAMGKANGLEYITDSALILKRRGIMGIEFIFLGDGSVRAGLENFCRQNEIDNVFFYGRVPMAETSEIVNLSDVSIVPFADIPILYTNSPNKLFDSLSAGKPIIVNSNGWTREMVQNNSCGYYVDPNKPAQLADIIVKLKINTSEVNLLGNNSRKLAEKEYDISILCKKFVSIINSLIISK